MLLDPSGRGKVFVLHLGSNTQHAQSRSEQNEKEAHRAHLCHLLSGASLTLPFLVPCLIYSP